MQNLSQSLLESAKGYNFLSKQFNTQIKCPPLSSSQISDSMHKESIVFLTVNSFEKPIKWKFLIGLVHYNLPALEINESFLILILPYNKSVFDEACLVQLLDISRYLFCVFMGLDGDSSQHSRSAVKIFEKNLLPFFYIKKWLDILVLSDRDE